ncbi:hypothetical protein H7J51_09650 [Mycobacterium crocinum]|uniref:DUF4352 domain-containing protein n=1 Tax=Mycolicibacterium crocinum TaxID=388459 RepID=A0ABY3TKX8_9MYCO|nr:hypothetical protein [Mycolicibacterium crocinum]MCV7215549.1 hypothetical protein [Mycolicibacterium crocinum]ULN39614.1 hypothetical protein MI149_17920 [Mycolicibacterium crocinum]
MKSPVPEKLRQRNVLAMVVVIAALAVLVVVDYWPDWSRYRDTTTPPHVISAGQSETIDGQTWSVAGIRHLDEPPGPRTRKLPKGTVLQVVSIQRTNGRDGDLCTGVITDGTRRWQAEAIGGYNVPLPDNASDRCTRSGPVQFTFLLPDDVVPTAVDVVNLDGRIRLRLQL